jgi:hypothetical protein
MKAFWAVFLLLLAPLAGVAQQTLPAWNADSEKAWWTQNPTPSSWPKAAADLRAELDASYKKDGASVFSQPDFQGWMEHLEWIQLGLSAPDLLAKPENLQTFIALGNDEKISHLLVEKMVPQDAPTDALGLLIKLAQANMADLHEYAALGVAYCLVFDVPFPGDWPHSQVAQSAVPIGDLDVVARFNFYVAANRNHKTDLDLSQQSFENLKHVVDNEVTLSELEYAQTKPFPYSDFAQAYSFIKYADWRIADQKFVYKWPYTSYQLQDIEDKAGICIDQSYYAALVGKGRGIPTIMFDGVGTDSAHAWFGYLDSSGEWQMDCGRYENGGFVKGYTRDPQTWAEVKDTTMEQFIKNGVSNPNYQAAETGLAWARLHGDDPSARTIYDDARSVMPELAGTWETESGYLDKTNASLDDQKAFYQAWITQFSAWSDLKVEGQQHLLAALQKANDPDAASLQQDIILQNRRDGIDLGVQGSAQTVKEKVDAHDWEGARLEFQEAIRDFSDQGGFTFYDDVLLPYVRACLQNGRVDQAEEGLHFAEDRLQIDPASQLGSDFGHLKDEVESEKAGLAAAQGWLGEIDAGNADQAWNESTGDMQAFVSADKWKTDITTARQKWGNVVSRTLTSLTSHKRIQKPDGTAIEGPFLEARFDTVFDAQPKVEETVVFKKTADNKWQALAYDSRVP